MAWKKLVLQKLLPANKIDSIFLFKTCFGTEFGEFAYIFYPWNGLSSIFLLCGTIRNGIREFSVIWNGSEWNSESLLLFLFHDTVFWAFFSSAEQFGTEFRGIFVPRNGQNSAGTNQLFCLFRLLFNNFLVGNCQPYLGYMHPSKALTWNTCEYK